MNQKLQLRFGILTAIVLVAALSRFLPHPPNFTPIGGIALFGAAYFHKRSWAFLVPFLALLASDMILNFVLIPSQFPQFDPASSWRASAWNYPAFALIVLLGFVLRRQLSAGRLLMTSFSASLLFFLVTNFGVWLNSTFYGQHPGGLLSAYVAGIPFFWNTLAGDLLYSALLFGSFEWISRRFPVLQAK